MGLDLPEDGEDEGFPLVPAVPFSVFSIAFAAATFAQSSAEASLAAGGAGFGTPIERTCIFCAVGPSPIELSLTTGSSEDSAGFGGGSADRRAGGEDSESATVGLFAIMGTLGC